MKHLLLFLFVFCSVPFYGQKVEQYCEMTAFQKVLSRKVTIDVDFGEERRLLQDNRLRDEMGKLKTFNTVVDALNYLGRLGWTMVNAFPTIEGSQTMYHYVLKKEFEKSELPDSSN